MIYLFTGDDAKNKISNYEKFIKATQSKVETFFVNKNDFNSIQIESLYSGSGLFFDKCVVVFINIFENESAREFILDKLKLISESKNDFVFLEGGLNKPIIEAFKKVKSEIKIFELPKEKKEKFDNFLLTKAFENRDKLNLWIYFRQAVDLGVIMEELIGVLFWKTKDMLLKKSFGKFSEEELKNFATKLSYLLPEARKNDIDAEACFEEFLLEAF